MPIKLNFTPVASKEEVKAKKQQAKVEKKVKKETTKRRKYLQDNSLYGTQLFEPIVSKEKLIAIHFSSKFLEDQTRISSCGKFAFRPMDEFHYELYYLKIPILEYDLDLKIEPNENQILFDLLYIEELESLLIELVRIEFKDEKDKLLLQLIEDERQIKLEKDRKEAEEDRLLEENENEINESPIESEHDGISASETNGSATEEQKAQTIYEQGSRQEEKVIQQENKIDGTLPRGFFFKQTK